MNLEIKPIEKLVLIDQIINTFELLISEGKLKPGDFIPSERDLAKMLNISRTSVRQGLKALNVLGVVEINPGSRSYLNKSMSKVMSNSVRFISVMNNIEVPELYDTRIIIEVELVKLATSKITSNNIEELKKILEKAKKHLGDPLRYQYFEKKFHDNISIISGDKILNSLMISINNLLVEARKKVSMVFSQDLDDLNQHFSIYEAIKEKDIEKAGAKMLEHLKSVKEKYVNLSDTIKIK